MNQNDANYSLPSLFLIYNFFNFFFFEINRDAIVFMGCKSVIIVRPITNAKNVTKQ